MVASRRMLKQISNFVLGSLASSTYPKGVRLRCGVACGLAREGARLGAPGWEGVIVDLFEHPYGIK
jgi:hypothetical protein